MSVPSKVGGAANCDFHLHTQGLKGVDSNGLSDPYVKLFLIPGHKKVLNLIFYIVASQGLAASDV